MYPTKRLPPPPSPPPRSRCVALDAALQNAVHFCCCTKIPIIIVFVLCIDLLINFDLKLSVIATPARSTRTQSLLEISGSLAGTYAYYDDCSLHLHTTVIEELAFQFATNRFELINKIGLTRYKIFPSI